VRLAAESSRTEILDELSDGYRPGGEHHPHDFLRLHGASGTVSRTKGLGRVLDADAPRNDVAISREPVNVNGASFKVASARFAVGCPLRIISRYVSTPCVMARTPTRSR
jgi:hypothetical protein